MRDNRRIGIVGLGLVGHAVALRLLSAGYKVFGYDISPDASERAGSNNVEVVPTLQRLAISSNRVLLCLPDHNAVRRVLWQKQGLARHARPSTTILDATTTFPDETVRHAERLSRQRIRFIDTPIIGSSGEIANRTAVVLVGAPEHRADFLPILKTFAQRWFFFRHAGDAHAAKLIVNLVLGLNRLVLAEGLGLAAHCGMDMGTVLEILRSSAAYSRVMDSKGERMCTGTFHDPVARLAQHAKDVRLILKLARKTRARTPLSRTHRRVLQEAIRHGWGDLDNSAVIKVFMQDDESDR